MAFFCNATQLNNEFLQKEIAVMETSKESSFKGLWVDTTKRHKVEKLVNRPENNSSFYFHNNPFVRSKDGKIWLMVFYGSTSDGNQIFTIDLKTRQIVQIKINWGIKVEKL